MVTYQSLQQVAVIAKVIQGVVSDLIDGSSCHGYLLKLATGGSNCQGNSRCCQ